MIRDDLAHAVRRVLADLELPEPPSGIVLEPSGHRDRGDWATPVALALQKVVGGNPLERAQRIAAALEVASVPHLARAEAAKPGFINLYLDRPGCTTCCGRLSPTAIATEPAPRCRARS